MTVTLADHARQLAYFARAFGDCIEDIKDIRHGVKLYYNIDFSLLCPLLFDRASSGVKEFLTSTKEGMRCVLDNATTAQYYKLVVSGPTVVEFFDQLDHLLRSLPDLQTRLPALKDRYNKKDASLLVGALKTSKDIKRDLTELSILTEQGQARRVRAPINKFLQLLDSGAICGIGDVVDARLVRQETNRALFDQFVEEHSASRRAGDPRSFEDSMFHYKIDAANNCLTIAASKMTSVSTPFVTPTPINIQQCKIRQRTLARLDRTPLFLMNLHRLKHAMPPQIGDELNFLESAAREAVALLEELRAYTNLDQVPNYTQLRLARFYRGPVALLDRGSRTDDAHMDDQQIAEILTVLSDHTRIQTVIKEAEQDIKDGARLVELHSSSFDLPYIDQLNLDNDPVISRIKKNLDVSFKQ